MSFARRTGLLKRPGRIAPRPAELRRWRDLVATVRTEGIDRAEGYGVSLDAMIDDAQAAYRDGFESDAIPDPETGRAMCTPERYAAGTADKVIWDGLRVAAILRPRLDGTLAVDRFDLDHPNP